MIIVPIVLIVFMFIMWPAFFLWLGWSWVSQIDKRTTRRIEDVEDNVSYHTNEIIKLWEELFRGGEK